MPGSGYSKPEKRTDSWRKARERFSRRDQIAAAVGAALKLDFALSEAAWADHNLPGNANEVGGGELAAWPLVGVVVKDVDPLGGEIAVELFTRGVGVGGTLLEVEDR